MTEMEMTGERMVTSFNNHFGKYEHLHRYALASEFVENRTVLDIACGEGYGTNLLSQKAKYIIGVDISNETIEHAKEKYTNKNIKFKTGSASNIPCNDKQFDIVISFETIEHHSEHDLMIREIKRVLKCDGIFIISSPEKEIYQLRDAHNLFHIKELTINELTSLLRTYFRYNEILRQLISVGSLIIPKEDINTKVATYDGDFYNIQKELMEYDFFNRPFFNIVLCSDQKIDTKNFPLVSFYNAYSVYENALIEKDQIIANLQSEAEKMQSSKLYKILHRIRMFKNNLVQLKSKHLSNL